MMTNDQYLENIDHEFNECVDEYKKILESVLGRIRIEEVREFVKEVLMHNTPTTYDELTRRNAALEKTQYLVYYLKARQMYNDMNPNKQTDTAIAAMLLHNLYFDGNKENWQQVFTARTELKEIADKYTTSASYGAFDYIFQIIEAQLGEDMPIPACRPVYGQVTYIVWEVIWFYDHQFKAILGNIEDDQAAYDEKYRPMVIESQAATTAPADNEVRA